MSRRRWLLYVAVSLLAVAAYFHGLSSLHIPKNGDEYVYAHITRLTAASGALLPLRAELPDGMRNTKPPLLFWQGILSTGWGEHWTLGRLRFFNVVYTLLTALLAGLLAWRLGGRAETGFLAGLCFLAFFTTYRYGRPFLTNPPEVFWLFVPLFLLLFFRPRSFDSKLLFPVLVGLATGVGLLYKTYFLLGPVGITLFWWFLDARGYRFREFLVRDAYKLAIVAALATSVFSLWFLFDPDPGSIWREFILKENLGKVARGSYLKSLLWGKSSLWRLAFGYLENAGLFVLPAAVVFISAVRRRKHLAPGEKALLIWLLVLFFVYVIPTQRSARHLLPGMPALAVLLALVWERVPAVLFRITNAAAAVVVLLLGAFSLALTSLPADEPLYPAWRWLVVLFGVAIAGVGLVRGRLAGFCALPAVFLAFFSISSFLYPFDHAFGTYPEETRRAVAGRVVWMPMNFNAKYERYYFLLPDSGIRGYSTTEPWSADALLKEHAFVGLQLPPGEAAPAGCRVLGERWDLRTRQKGKEIADIVFQGRFEPLLTREYLLESPR